MGIQPLAFLMILWCRLLFSSLKAFTSQTRKTSAICLVSLTSLAIFGFKLFFSSLIQTL